MNTYLCLIYSALNHKLFIILLDRLFNVLFLWQQEVDRKYPLRVICFNKYILERQDYICFHYKRHPISKHINLEAAWSIALLASHVMHRFLTFEITLCLRVSNIYQILIWNIASIAKLWETELHNLWENSRRSVMTLCWK